MTEGLPEAYRVAVSSDDGGPATVFEHLWTPYRMAYIRGENKPTGDHDCPFCLIPKMSDEDGLIVARGATVFAVLNLYPYNAGHLMLVPYRHVPDYTDLGADEVAEVGAFTQIAMRVVRSVSGAHGFNIGMNQGSVAGAGIADHLHQHVVPRWGGDTNFMPVIGLTRVLPQVLRESRDLLAAAWLEAADPDAPVVPAGEA
ncbi:MAG TPA: HIT domain-containing protein [Blastococcus sp.]|jgi:ATP adenylyltransferase|nr:HIT domain-containing protein [Blastococcus sp.]